MLVVSRTRGSTSIATWATTYGAGGWISDSQLLHTCRRSFPSAPEIQKNSFSSVIRGSGRPDADTSPPAVGRPWMQFGRPAIRIGELRYHSQAGAIQTDSAVLVPHASWGGTPARPVTAGPRRSPHTRPTG